MNQQPLDRGRGFSAPVAAMAIVFASLGREAYAGTFDGRSDDEALAFFEREVRPLLAEHCYECHGPQAKRAKGGLRFGTHAALETGGDSGPAISRTDPAASLMLRAISWTDPDLEMPPDGKLGDDAIATLTRWIELGAPWPEDAARPEEDVPEPAIDVAKGREWWSFRKVEAPPIPQLPAATATPSPIDAFVLAKLDAADLTPSPEADRATLARRVYFDLIGLPPTKDDLDGFVADPRPDAFERLVDALLARPEYGERWARHWLDVVRYADTCGYERDQPKLYAWRYRDYVIASLNADKPFDRFAMEQIAGDEIDRPTLESRIATGLYRLGAWDSEPDDRDLAEYDELDDSLRVISEGFLGVTIGCARCHDHKFDPFPQTDYYALLAFLRGVRPYEELAHTSNSPVLDVLDPSPDAMRRLESERKEARTELEKQIGEALAKGRKRAIALRLSARGYDPELVSIPAQARSAAARSQLAEAMKDPLHENEVLAAMGPVDAKEIKKLRDRVRYLDRDFTGSLDWGLVVEEHGRRALPTHLLVRGQPRSRGPEIEPRFPLVLGSDDAAALPHLPADTRDPKKRSSGRRRVLAEWITSKDNPLTARVIVNRVWHQHFGRGIVATPNDFGKTGDPPSHPELLDWLAAEFMANGWSLKWLHRTILASATWRQSSHSNDAAALALDPDNRLLWRQNPRRLDAEVIRDSMLAVSGTLESKRGGPGFYPELDRDVLAGSSRPGEGWQISSRDERRRRSIYSIVKRNLPVPFFEAFDAPSTTLPTGARTTTTVASQALSLLNGAFAADVADALARRLENVPDDEHAVRLFETILGRDPSPEERTLVATHRARALERCAATPPTATFAAHIPRRVSVDFLMELEPKDVLLAPTTEFTLVRGRFDNPYNVTLEMNDTQGPAALWDGATVRGGEVAASLRLRGDAPFGSLVVRATPELDGLVGIELRLERDRIRLLHHAATETLELGAAPLSPSPEFLVLRVSLEGGRIGVRIGADASLAIDVPDPDPSATGQMGFRTRDAGIEVRALSVTENDATRAWAIPQAPATVRADAEIALLLLNTNEFAFVD